MVVIDYDKVWVPVVANRWDVVLGVFDTEREAQLFIDSQSTSHHDQLHIQHRPYYTKVMKIPSGTDKPVPGWE